MSTSPIATRLEQGCAVITANNPPVNALGHAVRAGLMAALRSALADPAVSSVVITCAGRTFFAGADIREFGKPSQPPHLGKVLDLIEQADKPIVAAIHGTALGGGMELALACHARVIEATAKVGLPEVKLGLIPGAGGTQRTPRLIGLMAALDLVTSGRHVGAAEAKELGLVDHVVAADLEREAIDYARSLVGKPLRRTGELSIPACDQAAFDQAAMRIIGRARGQLSPRIAIEAVRSSATAPFRGGLMAERLLFQELVRSDQSRALRHAFFAEREVQRAPQLASATPRSLSRVGVIGAGTMGAGIAMALLDGGLMVTVVENDADAAARGRERIDGLMARALRSGRLSEAGRDERLKRLTVTDDFHQLQAMDLVIEAAFEDMAVKKEIFARLADVTPKGTVLATNTSYLDINEIARAAAGREADVIGLHFFSPANIMRLVEVVGPASADKDAVATGFALARRLGKLPVLCGVCEGFVGNRILAQWRQIAEFALEDGALPEEVDAALEAYGLAMGPFAVADLAGLDIAASRRRRLAGTRNPEARYSGAIPDKLVELGRLGQKTGAGFYRYENGARRSDPEVHAIIRSFWPHTGMSDTLFDGELLQRRIRAVMVNEGAKILAEGIVARPLDIDLVLIHGYGFPAWRGGPMFEADAIGLPQILADMEEVHARFGAGWEPAPLLKELARTNGRFADLGDGSSPS